jgi:hypothetical protein
MCADMSTPTWLTQDYYVHRRLFDIVIGYAELFDWQLEWEESREIRNLRRQSSNSTNVVLRIIARDNREAIRIAQQLDRGQRENAFANNLSAYGITPPSGFAYKPKAYDVLGKQMCDDVLYACEDLFDKSDDESARNNTSIIIGMDGTTLGISLGVPLGILLCVACCCVAVVVRRDSLALKIASYKKEYAMWREDLKLMEEREQTIRKRKQLHAVSTRFVVRSATKFKQDEGENGTQPRAYEINHMRYETVMSRLENIVRRDDVEGQGLEYDTIQVLFNQEDLHNSNSPIDKEPVHKAGFNQLRSNTGQPPPGAASPPRQIASAIRKELDERAKAQALALHDSESEDEEDDAASREGQEVLTPRSVASNTRKSTTGSVVSLPTAEFVNKNLWNTDAASDYNPLTARSEAAPYSALLTPRLVEIDAQLQALKEQLAARDRGMQSPRNSVLQSPRDSVARGSSPPRRSTDSGGASGYDAYREYLTKGFEDSPSKRSVTRHEYSRV